MAAGVKFQSFVEARGRKVHNLHTDVLKVALTNVQPDAAADTVFADIAEIAPGNGYVAGGVQIPNTSYVQTGGVAKLLGDDVTITAAGGPVGPFQWVVVYNDTALNKELIGYYPRPSAVTLADGEAHKTDFDQVNGIFQDT